MPLVALTGTGELAAKQTPLLRQAGLDVAHLPLISICETPSAGPVLAASVRQLTPGSWIVLTSQNSVRYVVRILQPYPEVIQRLLEGEIHLACVGRGTAESLARSLRCQDFVPSCYTGTCLAAELPVNPGDKVLLPGAEKMVSGLDWRLRQRGVNVQRLVLYRTESAWLSRESYATIRYHASVIVLCSPSAAASLQNNSLRIDQDRKLLWLRSKIVACIGTTTSQSLLQSGIAPQIMPDRFDLDSLNQAIIEYFIDYKKSKNKETVYV